MGGLHASGFGGELRHGYQCAAVIGAWRIEPDRRTWQLSADIVETRSYWIEQRPLDLVVRLGPVAWTWRNVAPTFTGAGITLDLGGPPATAD